MAGIEDRGDVCVVLFEFAEFFFDVVGALVGAVWELFEAGDDEVWGLVVSGGLEEALFGGGVVDAFEVELDF